MKNEYLDLCRRINIALSDKIIKESFDFKMPHRMGALSIRKGKLNICVKDGKLEKGKLIIDWGKSWAYWKEQYPGKTRKEINEIKGFHSPLHNLFLQILSQCPCEFETLSSLNISQPNLGLLF